MRGRLYGETDGKWRGGDDSGGGTAAYPGRLVRDLSLRSCLAARLIRGGTDGELIGDESSVMGLE
jgi:hypothetical protein